MSGAEAALRAYADALARGDIDEGVSLLHLPTMYVSPQGVTVFSDAEVARTLLGIGTEQMRSEGYHHTEFPDLTKRELSQDVVALSGTLVRRREDGSELNRVGFTYTFRSDAGSWKLVCGIIHDVPAV